MRANVIIISLLRVHISAFLLTRLVTARGRLLGLADATVTAVANAIHGGDPKLALRLLERMDIARPAKPGSANVEELQRKEGLRGIKKDAEFYEQRQMAELTKLLSGGGHLPAQKKHDQEEDDGERWRNLDRGG